MRKQKKRRAISVRIIAFNDMQKAERFARAKPVTLAGSGPRPTGVKKVLDAKKRHEVSDALFRAMQGWRSTPFESEGIMTAGLRSTLCLDGHQWRSSDFEARLLVDGCLERLRAVRPTWEQGQRSYSLSSDQCAWCHGSVPEELDVGTYSTRYCSAMCARSAMQHRDFEDRENADKGYQAAKVIIRRASNPIVQCLECSKSFRPLEPDGKFCSHQCHRAELSRTLRVLPDYDCGKCGKTFRPTYAKQKFCSEECKYAAHCDYREEKACECCGHAFMAMGRKAQFCSTDCARVVRRFKLPETTPHRLAPRVFDYMLRREGARITDVRCEAV